MLGPNGAGKSTLVNVITCAIPFKKGEININNMSIPKWKHAIKNIMSIATQNYAIDFLLSVEDNLIPFIYLYNLDIKNGTKLMNELLERFNLIDKKKVLSCNISGGQLRRLQIIRALLKQPELLILDEPTIGLDPIARNELGKILKDYVKQGKTVFLATNEMNEAEMLCDRVAFVRNGTILDIKPVNDLIIEHVGELTYEIQLSEKNIYEEIIKVIRKKDAQIHIVSEDPLVICKTSNPFIYDEVVNIIKMNNVVTYDIKKRRSNLTDVFMKLARR